MSPDPVAETQLLRLSDHMMSQAIHGFTVAEATACLGVPAGPIIADMVKRKRLAATGTGRFAKVRPVAPEPAEPKPRPVIPPRPVPLPVQGSLFGGIDGVA